MSQKRLSKYNIQLVNRNDVESGGQLIESNIEPLAEGNRIEQGDIFKRPHTAYITI